MINVELRIIYAFLREDENRSQNTHEYSKHSTITLRHPVLVCRSFHPVLFLSLSYLLLPRPYLSFSHASHMCIAIFLSLSFLHDTSLFTSVTTSFALFIFTISSLPGRLSSIIFVTYLRI